MRILFRKLTDGANAAENIAAILCGYLSGSFCVQGFYPLACAAYMGFATARCAHIAAFSGIVLGILMHGAIHILPLLICAGLYLVWNAWKGDELKMTDRVLILSVACMTELVFNHSDMRSCLLTTVMCGVSIAAYLMMYNGISSVSTCLKRKRIASDEELLYISLFAGTAVLLLTPFSIGGFSAAISVCGALCMAGSGIRNTGGLYVSLIASLGAGYSYGDGSYSFAVAGVMCVSCMICALLGKGEKLRTVICFSVCSVLMGYIMSHSISIADTAAAAAIYICLPKKLVRSCGAYLSAEKRKKDSGLLRRIDALAKAAGGMSDVYETAELPYDGKLAIKQICAMSGLLESINDERQAKCSVNVDVGLACIPKANCAHTGDSVGRADTGGKTVVVLSDGMGSGLLAHNESAAAVESFLDMQRAGFNTYDSIDAVNRKLISGSENDFYATLDAVVTDRHSAIVTMVKMGAPPTFHLRDGKVTEISGESLPIGIIESVKPAVRKMQAKPGDIFILMSDGAQDALGKDVLAAIAENISTGKTSKENANILLDLASSDGVQDDMSIVCIRISDS